MDDTADLETLVFDISTIRNATDDFSDENHIGQGGFGTVYKVCEEKFLAFFLSFANS